MKMGKSFQALVERAQKSAAYWAAGIALDFAEEVEIFMKRKKISRADLAKKMDTSAPYVSKVLRGEANFTLETMVKIAMAVDAEIEVHLIERNNSAMFTIPSKRKLVTASFASNVYVPLSMQAANECTRDNTTTTTTAAA